MTLINILYLLICVSTQTLQIIESEESAHNFFDKVSRSVEDIANRLFHLLHIHKDFVNSIDIQRNLHLYSEIKNSFYSHYSILDKVCLNSDRDINKVGSNDSEIYGVISEILNISYKLDPFSIYLKDSSLNDNDINNINKEFFEQNLETRKDKAKQRRVIRRRRSSSRRNYRRIRNLDAWKPGPWRNKNETRRIYKGKRTGIGHYPFMVSIHENEEFVCSGCIVRRDLVITSASCLQKVYTDKCASSIKLRVGSDYIYKGGYLVTALHAIFHSSYDPVSLHNNLVLLNVDDKAFAKINFEWIKRIKYQHSHDTTHDSDVTSVKILGWGEQMQKEDDFIMESIRNISNPHTESTVKRHDVGLSFDLLDMYSLEECMNIYSRYFVTKNHLCAGFILRGNGVCKYDVGGPGIFNGLLVGIISFGPERCGIKDKPTVFTKIAPYVKWIHEVATEVIPKLKKKETLPKTRKQGSLNAKKFEEFIKKTFPNSHNTDINHRRFRKHQKNRTNMFSEIEELNLSIENFTETTTLDNLPSLIDDPDDSYGLSIEIPTSTGLFNASSKTYWVDMLPLSKTTKEFTVRHRASGHSNNTDNSKIRKHLKRKRTTTQDLAAAIYFERYLKLHPK